MQLLQIVVFDRLFLALDKAHPVEQILAGKLSEPGSGLVEPGIPVSYTHLTLPTILLV